MKRNMIIGGLVMSLLLGVAGCDDGSSDDASGGKTVDSKYWGEYWAVNDTGENARKILVEETQIKWGHGIPKNEDIRTWSTDVHTRNAWSDKDYTTPGEAALMYGDDAYWGYFVDGRTLMQNNITEYKKR